MAVRPITDGERLDALQKWLDSADLQAGTITFRLPGLAEGKVRVGADVRRNIDAAIEAEPNLGRRSR